MSPQAMTNVNDFSKSDAPDQIPGWRIGHPNYPDPSQTRPVCFKRLECGAYCYRLEGHAGPCLCTGDFGVPGNCPA